MIFGRKSVVIMTGLWLGALTVAGMGREDASCGWALTNVSVACVRENAGHAAELGTQVVMGTPVKILGRDGSWCHVEAPDGYKGYVIDNSLVAMSDAEMDAWRKAVRYVVTAPDQTYVYEPGGGDEAGGKLRRMSDVVNGCILQADGAGTADRVAVCLPDGRKGYVDATDVALLDEWAGRDMVDQEEVVAFALNLMGTPYLWGGTSTKSMDCSGLTKICYLAQGIVLPRNASAQALIGRNMDKKNLASWKKGDLLFFGNGRTGRVNHVGIYMEDGRFVHSSGRVKVNSINRTDPLYHAQDLIAVRRLERGDLEGMKLANHDWYFSK